MRMKTNYPRIANRIYRQPWAILPSMHESIRRQFEAHIAKGAKADMPNDSDPTEDQNETQPQATNGIGIIPIYGVLGSKLGLMETMCGGVDVEDVGEQLKAFRDNPDIACILLDIASPGGCVTGIPELAQLISDCDKVKPVYAYSSDQTCSAAYWLASQARAFVVSPSSSIGSVGCYIYLEDHTRELEIAGVKPNPIVSESSPLKLAGADFKPLTDTERAMFQADVDGMYTQFVGAINAKRQCNAEFLKGQVVDGTKAVEVGLADGLANDMEEMLTILATAK